jgi:hypothetical protein
MASKGVVCPADLSTRASLPAAASVLERDELIRKAGAYARRHYEAADGELLVWGKIAGYKLVVAEEEQVALDVFGRAIGVEGACMRGIALLALR